MWEGVDRIAEPTGASKSALGTERGVRYFWRRTYSLPDPRSPGETLERDGREREAAAGDHGERDELDGRPLFHLIIFVVESRRF